MNAWTVLLDMTVYSFLYIGVFDKFTFFRVFCSKSKIVINSMV